MKKIGLSDRSIICIVILLLMGIVNAVMTGILISNKIVPASPLNLLISAEVMLHLVIGIAAFRWLVKPYREMSRLYQRFADGNAYEELFDAKYLLLPGWSEVMNKMRHLLNKQDAIRMSKKQAEYLALQNQINPHFLYNTLEAIRGDAICAGLESIAETTEALSIFFRYSITGVDRLVTLEEEIDNVENYFTIQHYRFGEKVNLKMTCPAEEEVLKYRIPKLTIQPFVENAIYHGIEKKIQGGTVKVHIETTVQKLIITVSDDGVGMPREQVEHMNEYMNRVAVSYVGEDKARGGIAVKNVNSRIKLLFGEEYGIQVYSVKNIGTDIRILLPKMKESTYEKRTASD